ncbi:hypothetical protein GJAV_G00212440 [Gymnothorax javanicus]|nr:hypothetical protein GJAV_G00212440 [Gymnothorax javanicus]
MGDGAEVQITPETPGRPGYLNPFDSPNDYLRLHESVVPSPSVFKSSRVSSASLCTPSKFKWSIDEMASLLPVDIDPEEIHQQSSYFRQMRTDSDIEKKRQNAIEQFFRSGPIVPSPWASSANKLSKQMHFMKSSLSPDIPEEEPPVGTCTVSAACQTVLSLPVDFDLEKILGEHYKMDEVSDQVQESLSSSSLRRKLFLDGNESGSDSSTPPSPDQSPREQGPEVGQMLGRVSVSPLQCEMAALSPTFGHFSSSPIQSRSRAYSLGSVTSPMFAERASPGFKSPKLSPISFPSMETPVSGGKDRLTFLTPEGVALGRANRTVSPYVEGCSPIKRSPVTRSPIGDWAPSHPETSHSLTSAPLLGETSSGRGSVPPIDMEVRPQLLDSSHMNCSPALPETHDAPPGQEPEEEGDDPSAVNMADPAEDCEEYCSWDKRSPGDTAINPASSHTNSMMPMESTSVFMSLLCEGSSVPYDSSSMQVESGILQDLTIKIKDVSAPLLRAHPHHPWMFQSGGLESWLQLDMAEEDVRGQQGLAVGEMAELVPVGTRSFIMRRPEAEHAGSVRGRLGGLIREEATPTAPAWCSPGNPANHSLSRPPPTSQRLRVLQGITEDGVLD